MSNRLAAVGATGIGVLAAMTVAAPSAHANSCPEMNTHTVQTFAAELHVVVGSGTECESSQTTEYWVHHQTREDANPWSPQICRYQGFIAQLAPNGSVVRNSYSNYHASCSFFQSWVNWSDFAGLYPEDTGFRHKWKSAATGDQWLKIGDIRD